MRHIPCVRTFAASPLAGSLLFHLPKYEAREALKLKWKRTNKLTVGLWDGVMGELKRKSKNKLPFGEKTKRTTFHGLKYKIIQKKALGFTSLAGKHRNDEKNAKFRNKRSPVVRWLVSGLGVEYARLCCITLGECAQLPTSQRPMRSLPCSDWLFLLKMTLYEGKAGIWKRLSPLQFDGQPCLAIAFTKPSPPSCPPLPPLVPLRVSGIGLSGAPARWPHASLFLFIRWLGENAVWRNGFRPMFRACAERTCFNLPLLWVMVVFGTVGLAYIKYGVGQCN